MGIVGTIKREARSRVTAGASLEKPPSWLARLLGGYESTAAGIDVNEYTALNLSTFWCAVRNISDDVAKIPVGVYTREANARKELAEDPVTVILNREPNFESLPISFRGTMQSWALTWGNAVAEIEWYNNGRPAALWQQPPPSVHITRDKSDRIVYEFNSVRKGGRTIALYADSVFHLHGIGFDGVTGYSVVHKARESLGLSLATERYGAQFFGNGATPAAILSTPHKLADQGARLKESWNEANKGPGKSRGIAVLEADLKYQAIGIPPEDGQFLETRQFQVTEIARWFRMPPHKLMDLLRGTFSNIEHQSIEYVTDCLEPWFIRWEQEAQRKFFGKKDPRYVRHNIAALLRSDAESRARKDAIYRQWGVENVNEIRAREDMNPIGEQGDIYLSPSNMVPADRLGKLTDATIDGKSKPEASNPPPANPENGNQNRAAELARGLRSQVAETAERMARAGDDKMQRAAKKPGFEAWRKAFRTEHSDFVRGAFFPIAEAVVSLRTAFAPVGTVPVGAQDVATAMARRYMEAFDKLSAGPVKTSDFADSVADDEVRHIEAIIAGGTP